MTNEFLDTVYQRVIDNAVGAHSAWHTLTIASSRNKQYVEFLASTFDESRSVSKQTSFDAVLEMYARNLGAFKVSVDFFASLRALAHLGNIDKDWLFNAVRDLIESRRCQDENVFKEEVIKAIWECD